MIISLMGTPWIPAIRNSILVLEDTSEHLLRIERILLQLYHAGVLVQQNAITLDSFSDSAPNGYDADYNLDPVCSFLRARLSVPLIYGLGFGHEQRTVALPLEANVVLEDDKNGTRLTLSGRSVLKS